MDAEAESRLSMMESGEERSKVTLEARPATASATTTSTPSSPSSSTDRCVICLDTIAEHCVAQPCGHRDYDFLCLVSWLLQHKPSCPLCKAAVDAVQYGDDFTKTFSVPKKAESSSGAEAAASESVSTQAPLSLSADSRPPRTRPRRRPAPATSSSSSYISSPSPEAALERRRHVYRLGLYARHVGANRHSRYYRELTPQLFAQDPDLVSRARAFLRRELQVFWADWGAQGQRDERPHAPSSRSSRSSCRTNNVEFLLEYIVAILQSIDLQDSAGQAEELLQGFFRSRRDHTRHFLHELRSFLRSPYLTLANWDRHVQYSPLARLPVLGTRDDNEEEGGEATTTEDNKHVARPTLRGDYWRPPSRRRRSGNSRATGVTSRASRQRLEEACRRYDPS
ncbi:ring finger domain containing protein [Sporothrix brasiliensis 5110]|uniref:RING-type E3 ubiquitin transferase n=1 Tax=Sporothrix brasiliensis 5110 TaxID=1398154 RepID=A0A0C2IVI3_9PEZI|nr:ring finger domain containing protein [Sporothrix brasiliensis 5110]KIH89007.1 ring finger domain containing protein [Sporothrix brasiliensis 5110]